MNGPLDPVTVTPSHWLEPLERSKALYTLFLKGMQKKNQKKNNMDESYIPY